MKSFFKKTFIAVYMLSPIIIVLFVSMMAGGQKRGPGTQINDKQEMAQQIKQA